SAVVSLSAWLSAAERPADRVKLVSTFRVLSSAITICFFTETSVCGGPKRWVVAERWDDYFHHVRENPLTPLELSSSKRQLMAHDVYCTLMRCRGCQSPTPPVVWVWDYASLNSGAGRILLEGEINKRCLARVSKRSAVDVDGESQRRAVSKCLVVQ